MPPLSDWLENIGAAALSSKETLRATYDIATLAIKNGIPGDFCECGVFGGTQAAAMALAIIDKYCIGEGHALAAGVPRRVHLFDSFEGIPEPGPHDLEFLAEKHPAGLSACSREAVQSNMRQWGIPDELLVYHAGWFTETLGPAKSVFHTSQLKQIAVLRLDGDLYESTLTCLKSLYPLLSPGGWCIIDDYALSGCRKACDEYFVGRQPGPHYFIKP